MNRRGSTSISSRDDLFIRQVNAFHCWPIERKIGYRVIQRGIRFRFSPRKRPPLLTRRAVAGIIFSSFHGGSNGEKRDRFRAPRVRVAINSSRVENIIRSTGRGIAAH